MVSKTRKIEIFSAGCSLCQDVVEQVKSAACSSCDIQVLNMAESDTRSRASSLGIKSVPAVVIDGQVAGCFSNRGVDIDQLRAAGLGQALP